MFAPLTTRVRSEVETLKLVIETHDRFREFVFSRPEATPEHERYLQGKTKPSEQEFTSEIKYLEEIRSKAPTKSAWQVYDHCAAFTRLYAVYEQFVEDLVSEYLQMLPALYPSYEDLPPSVATQHRIGVGQILLKLGKDGPFKDLQVPAVIQGLSRGVLGDAGYALFPDAFLVDPQNYRSEMVVKLFTYVGLNNCWPWVEKHPQMSGFMQKSRDPNETSKTVLHEFVEYRNKASHTVVADIVSSEEIKSVADFVVILCEALTQLVMKQVVTRKKELGEVEHFGRVLHRFSGNIVGVKMAKVDFKIGDELLIVNKQSCFGATVVSIKIDQTLQEKFEAQEGQEVGIKLSVRVNENSDLLRLKGKSAAVVSEEPLSEPTTQDEDLQQPDEETGALEI
jgi:hypothetical protein